jgi:NADH:ubiquinone oxidoreductase subunit K
MHSIINIWLVLFWISWFLFFFNTNNLIKLFITSELVWLTLYVYALIVGIYVDDAHLFILSLLIITIASIEFSIGFILIIFFKKIFKKTNLIDPIVTDWTHFLKINKK